MNVMYAAYTLRKLIQKPKELAIVTPIERFAHILQYLPLRVMKLQLPSRQLIINYDISAARHLGMNL